LDVSWLQVGEFRQDIIFCIAPSKILKKGDNWITQSTDAGLTVANLRIDGDSGEQFTFRHNGNKADLYLFARSELHHGRRVAAVTNNGGKDGHSRNEVETGRQSDQMGDDLRRCFATP
jgi:hypothetical protein